MKKRLLAMLLVIAMLLSVLPSVFAQEPTQSAGQKVLKLWYDEPASDDSVNGTPATYTNHATSGWERFSLPLGNGYLGASVFGRTDRERVQLTENSLYTYDQGLTNFAETYIYFDHDEATDYYRDLVLDDAVAHVQYKHDGVTYNREYFASYPDKVLVIRLTADQDGALDFVLGPELPFLDSETSVEAGTKKSSYKRCGKVEADAETATITISEGSITGYAVEYAGQYKILTDGTVAATRGSEDANIGNDDDTCNDQLKVTGATYATILASVGTNYELDPNVFLELGNRKLNKSTRDPAVVVPAIVAAAAEKTYDQLKSAHLEDYKTYFDRVTLDLGGELSDTTTTDQLLNAYKNGTYDPYLEELYFQYGRYLLIASSREGGLPANLQGIWNQYDMGVCKVGYWHNINTQMNYWPAFSTNLSEMFAPYVDYFNAYLPAAQEGTSTLIKKQHEENLDENGNNGWANYTGMTAYEAGEYEWFGNTRDGYGNAGLTSEVLWDYYRFTQDKEILSDFVYPAIYGSSNFLSRVMHEVEGYEGLLLSTKTGSPEQRYNLPEGGVVGPGWDQQMAYGNHKHTLQAAAELGIDPASDSLLQKFQDQMPKLDPVQVGYSGQIKEFREETYYGEYGEELDHRHISHLVGLYPGDTINSSTRAWQDASAVALRLRATGHNDAVYAGTGWGLAHRLNAWARLGDSEMAYGTLQFMLKNRTMENLWDEHPPFQIDGNFGGTAGVAEMLLQSHEEYINLLPALPSAWANGSYSGLVAQGNFEVGVDWTNGQATGATVTSNVGGTCNLQYANLAQATVTDSNGSPVEFTADGNDRISFDTTTNETYTISGIPTHVKPEPASALKVEYPNANAAVLSWTAGDNAQSYTIYRATNNDADYTKMADGVTATTYTIDDTVVGSNQYTYAVAAVVDGRESIRTTVTVPPIQAPENVTGVFVDDTTLQITIEQVNGANAYEVCEKKADDTLTVVKTTPYATVVVENASKNKTYVVRACNGGVFSDPAPMVIKDQQTISKLAMQKLLDEIDALDLTQYDVKFVAGLQTAKPTAVALFEQENPDETAYTEAYNKLKSEKDMFDMLSSVAWTSYDFTNLTTQDIKDLVTKGKITIKNRDDSLWTCTEDGLSITPSGTMAAGTFKNLFTVDGSDDYIATTSFDMTLGSGNATYHDETGFVIYINDYTYLRFANRRHEEISVEISKGSTKDKSYKTISGGLANKTVNLMLQKKGNMYSFYYSLNDGAYVKLCDDKGFEVSNPMLSIFSGKHVTTENATFKYFNVSKNPLKTSYDFTELTTQDVKDLVSSGEMTIKNRDDSLWTCTEDGLSITPSGTMAAGTFKNLFTVDGSGDYSATTSFDMTLGSGNSTYNDEAGFVIYINDYTYLRFTNRRHEEICVETSIGSTKDKSYKTISGGLANKTVNLMLQKKGNMYSFYYSLNDGEYVKLCDDKEFETSNPMLSIFAGKHVTTENATFKYFNITRSPKIDINDLTYNNGTAIASVTASANTTANLIFAAYDSENSLVSVDVIENVTVLKGEKTYDSTANFKTAGATEIKFMIWNSDITPLCKGRTTPLN